MEDKTSLLEPLLDSAKEYSKTSYELIKLKAVDKAVDVSSTLLSRLLFLSVLLLFIISLNIGISLWLGNCAGNYIMVFLL